MWGAIISGVSSIFNGWVKVKVSKQESDARRYEQAQKIEGDWDTTALRMSETSWKDEFLTLIIFSPLVVAWFDDEKALRWVKFVQELPVFYQVFMAGIICASFGLRWFFKQQGFKVAKNKSDL